MEQPSELEIEYQAITDALVLAKDTVKELERKKSELEKRLFDGTEYQQFYYP